MSKTIFVKLTKANLKTGPFNIYDNFDNIIDENVPRKELLVGKPYTVANSVSLVKLVSTGQCSYEKVNRVEQNVNDYEFFNTPIDTTTTACLWHHLKNNTLYNEFYGQIHSHIIENIFAYTRQDEILQNVEVYTKVFKYLSDGTLVSNEALKVETDDEWYNKAIVYNGQQSSGLLKLSPKPKNNLKGYMSYPIFGIEDKTILFTKSDNFYQFNTFWSVVKDKTLPLFIRTCLPLSYDKTINQSNMDYSARSFIKAPLRAKDVRVRLILDDRSDVHIISQILVASSMLSYK